MDKRDFLNHYAHDYGYPNGPKNIDQIRATEFNRLTNEVVYLDHAGATLYSELQLQAVFNDLASNVYSNPHSQSDASTATSEVIKECRQQVLDFCNASAKEYKCIFTSGATAALKMVGEAFPWSSQSHFMYTMENHNSVIGIREYALSHGAAACAVDVEELVDQDRLSIDKGSMFKVSQHAVQTRSNIKFHEEDAAGSAYHLFAFPSECNFSGVRFNLDLVKAVREHPEKTFKDSMVANGRLLVLIDAAKGCATEPPDLSKYPADFVVLSFYKIFGYPSGLGALIVRNEAAKLLKKTYFSGGTVASSIADIDFVKHRDGIEESWEDGTVSFLSIASIRPGFRIVNALTMSSISRHTSSLARYLRGVLSKLKHENGADVCILYGQDDSKVSVKKGPIVSFNLKRADGSWFGYREVEKLASLSGLQIRTGCFCNPGACAKYLGLSHLELLSNVEAGHVCWDDNDIVNGKPTGAVRVSFGYMSTFEEAKKFVDFIRSSFVAQPTPERIQFQLAGGDIFPIKGQKRIDKAIILKSIVVYPIKSCAGFRVDSWPLSNTGLLHDREWIIKSASGEILTQKKVPEMTLISTYIDLNKGILYVESPSCETELQILIASVSGNCDTEDLNISGRRYEAQCYGHEVNSWFTKAIGRPCTLWKTLGPSCRLDNGAGVAMCRDVDSSLSFVNEAQFLLVSEESVSDLNSRLSSKMFQPCRLAAVQVLPMRFRPNLIVSGGEPYAEDVWSGVRVGNKYFRSVGGCNRCQMINFDLQSGKVQKTREPLATLATYRRIKGRILFGVLLRYENSELTNEETRLEVGEEMHPEMLQM